MGLITRCGRARGKGTVPERETFITKSGEAEKDSEQDRKTTRSEGDDLGAYFFVLIDKGLGRKAGLNAGLERVEKRLGSPTVYLPLSGHPAWFFPFLTVSCVMSDVFYVHIFIQHVSLCLMSSKGFDFPRR